jgi:hypothetical protein
MTQAEMQNHQRAIRSIDRIRMHVDYRPHRDLDAALDRLRRILSGEGDRGAIRTDVTRLASRIERRARVLAPSVRELASELILAVREIAPAFQPSLEIESRPLLGVLPLARVVPQDVHSVMDYAGGLATLAPIFFARKREAKIAGAALGASVIGLSLVTDYRLSLRKLVPIEAHEAMDYVWGASCIAAPFVFGYSKKDPLAAALHVASGVATIVASLFTDYRAAVGRGRSDVDVAAMQGARIQPGVSSHLEY